MEECSDSPSKIQSGTGEPFSQQKEVDNSDSLRQGSPANKYDRELHGMQNKFYFKRTTFRAVIDVFKKKF